MDRVQAEKELRSIPALYSRLKMVTEYIRELEEDLVCVRGYSCDSTPVQGGGRKYDEIIDGKIERLDEVREERLALIRRIRTHEATWAILDEEDQRILDGFFIHRIFAAKIKLSGELMMSPSTVNRHKIDALNRYCYIYNCLNGKVTNDTNMTQKERKKGI